MKDHAKKTGEELAAYHKDRRERIITHRTLGGKHKKLILLAFENGEKKSYSALANEIRNEDGTKISSRTLSKDLKSHVQNGFLNLVDSAVSTDQKDYKATPHGLLAIKSIRGENIFAALYYDFMNEKKKE